jgi:LmbE family N-acetylglucosaminyl deacetylase
VLVDITGTTVVKSEALGCYVTQLHEDPQPRSLQKIQAMDQAAGAALGTQAVERFVAYRIAC